MADDDITTDGPDTPPETAGEGGNGHYGIEDLGSLDADPGAADNAEWPTPEPLDDVDIAELRAKHRPLIEDLDHLAQIKRQANAGAIEPAVYEAELLHLVQRQKKQGMKQTIAREAVAKRLHPAMSSEEAEERLAETGGNPGTNGAGKGGNGHYGIEDLGSLDADPGAADNAEWPTPEPLDDVDIAELRAKHRPLIEDLDHLAQIKRQANAGAIEPAVYEAELLHLVQRQKKQGMKQTIAREAVAKRLHPAMSSEEAEERLAETGGNPGTNGAGKGGNGHYGIEDLGSLDADPGAADNAEWPTPEPLDDVDIAELRAKHRPLIEDLDHLAQIKRQANAGAIEPAVYEAELLHLVQRQKKQGMKQTIAREAVAKRLHPAMSSEEAEERLAETGGNPGTNGAGKGGNGHYGIEDLGSLDADPGAADNAEWPTPEPLDDVDIAELRAKHRPLIEDLDHLAQIKRQANAGAIEPAVYEAELLHLVQRQKKQGMKQTIAREAVAKRLHPAMSSEEAEERLAETGGNPGTNGAGKGGNGHYGIEDLGSLDADPGAADNAEWPTPEPVDDVDIAELRAKHRPLIEDLDHLAQIKRQANAGAIEPAVYEAELLHLVQRQKKQGMKQTIAREAVDKRLHPAMSSEEAEERLAETGGNPGTNGAGKGGNGHYGIEDLGSLDADPGAADNAE